MTIERVITSHSERSVAVQRGLVANDLATSASQTLHLLRILSSGKKPSNLPGLVEIAQEFIAGITKYSTAVTPKLKFTHLIPYALWDDVAQEDPELRALAGELRELIEMAEVSSVEEDAYFEKLTANIQRLERLRSGLDNVAGNASKTSVLA